MDMTAEKTREMLWKNEQRLKENFGASALVTHSYSNQNIAAGSCWHCGKPGHKKDSC